jgi:hypothetical protein
MALAAGPLFDALLSEIEWRGHQRYPSSTRCHGIDPQGLPSAPCYERMPQGVSPPPEVQHHRNATLRGHEEKPSF